MSPFTYLASYGVYFLICDISCDEHFCFGFAFSYFLLGLRQQLISFILNWIALGVLSGTCVTNDFYIGPSP